MAQESVDIEVDSISDTAEAPSYTELAALVADLGKTVQTLQLAEQVRSTRAPAGIAQAPTTKSIMKGLKKGEAAGGQTRSDPSGLRPAFKMNDVVALVNADKLSILVAGGFATVDEPFLGVVKARMYRRRRDNQMKYNVDFPGIGEDGAMESELEMIQEFE